MSTYLDSYKIAHTRYPKLDGRSLDCCGEFIRVLDPTSRMWKIFRKNGIPITVESLKYPKAQLAAGVPPMAPNSISFNPCEMAHTRYPELARHYLDCSGEFVLHSLDGQQWKGFQKNGRNITVESLKHPEMTVDPPNTNNTSALTFANACSTTSSLRNSYVYTDLDRFTQTFKEKKMSTQKRLVKIFVVDPNENVPMEDSIMWQRECLTDETDVELLQQMGMVEILARHNAKREKILDKTRSLAMERDIYLEPAKLRDVVSRVITVATF